MKLGELLNNTKRNGDCMIWQGNVMSDGYGRVYVDHKPWRVHRLIITLVTRQPIPKGYLVCHTCDTPLCCNPDHLFLGTPKQNHHDAMAKGRHTKGEKVNTAKLTEQQVIEILHRWHTATKKYGLHSSLAREFGVTSANIRGLVLGKTWRHLQG